MTCSLPIMYNDDTWATTTSPDQFECNRVLEELIYPDGHPITNNISILHVGIGTSSTYQVFSGARGIKKVVGITIMDSEILVARENENIFKREYEIHKVNKYSIDQMESSIIDNFDFIIDNNMKQHACCDKHWRDYLAFIVDLLHENGVLITHTQGFQPHTTNIGPLSLMELLQTLPSGFRVTARTQDKNEHGQFPILIQRSM
jgi:cyclopropane fatty-acyl-phospholipid synthase-like methyltransferase